MSILTGITDFFGATDSGASQRGRDAYAAGMKTANEGLDALTGEGGAVTNYQNKMTGAGGIADQMMSTDASAWLNPKMNVMTQQAAQNVRGAGGGDLGSSANNNAIADRVAQMSAGMWDNAMQNKQNALKTTADVYGASLQPTMDIASQKYNAATSQAQGDAQLAGQSQSLWNSIF